LVSGCCPPSVPKATIQKLLSVPTLIRRDEKAVSPHLETEQPRLKELDFQIVCVNIKAYEFSRYAMLAQLIC
jgi:hypothetical protein